MLPGRIVGSAVIAGKARPFSLDGASGEVELDRYDTADPMQRSIGPMERQAIERQVKSATGAASLRIGAYRCPICHRWVDVVRDPAAWAGDRCAAC